MVVVAAAGCAGRGVPARGAAEAVGSSHRPYTAIPSYLRGKTEPPLGPPGRWDERVPVASLSRDTPRIPDELRLRLADLDEAAISLRGTPSPRSVGEVARAAEAVAELVRRRPDLAAEADELREAARRMERAPPVESDLLIDRVLEVTDLMRIQLRAA